MVNYQKGKIYKVESHQGDKIYNGSTTKDYLCQRMDLHRSQYKRYKDGKTNGYVSVHEIFDEYGIENCNIILIESYPCNTSDELHSREAHHIKLLKCVNKNIPGRSKLQYYHDNKNKESMIEYKKKYYEANKDILNAKQRERRRLIKEQNLIQ